MILNMLLLLLKGTIAYIMIVMWQAILTMYPFTGVTLIYMMIMIMIWRCVRDYHLTIIIGEDNVTIDSKR
jgi:uncharacterized membrane protein